MITFNYYINTCEIPGFFVLLKHHIFFIARSEDTITCEDIGVAIATKIITIAMVT